MGSQKRNLGHYVFYGICYVLGLALIEPVLGHLEKMGDLLTSKQYLFIAPAGEVAYALPSVRRVPLRYLKFLGLALMTVGVIPPLSSISEGGLDHLECMGLATLISSLGAIYVEYVAKGEWIFGRGWAVRYLSLPASGLGAFAAHRSRKYLASMGMASLVWDISSAIFWAAHERDINARVPVPYRGDFQEKAKMGVPCWQVFLVDLSGICFFFWLSRGKRDPLGLFNRGV